MLILVVRVFFFFFFQCHPAESLKVFVPHCCNIINQLAVSKFSPNRFKPTNERRFSKAWHEIWLQESLSFAWQTHFLFQQMRKCWMRRSLTRSSCGISSCCLRWFRPLTITNLTLYIPVFTDVVNFFFLAVCSAGDPGGWGQGPTVSLWPGPDFAADAAPQVQAGLHSSLQPAPPHPSLLGPHLPHRVLQCARRVPPTNQWLLTHQGTTFVWLYILKGF